MAKASQRAPQYVRIAEILIGQMERGVLRPGDRAPSLRKLSQQQRVSVTTALQCYMWLENRGYLEARARSGFFVRQPFAAEIPEPKFEAGSARERKLGMNDILSDVFRTANDPANIGFGACASPELFPIRRLNLNLRRIVHRDPAHSSRYDFPPGLEQLRRQIARRVSYLTSGIAPGDVVITSGALEAVTLGLKAVARAGDAIAVESPTYFGILAGIASMGMKIVEIPTHPQEGMDLNELERAIRKHRIKACVTMPNCHNPLGYVLPDQHKRDLADLAGRTNMAVIEDDVYGDLAAGEVRPRTIKSFDRKGLVILCSSFSKTLPAGYRVGYAIAGRFHAEVERLKFVTTVATGSLSQRVIADFLESGGYDRHLKRLRTAIASQVETVRQAIARYFPAGTRISRPAGGHLLWVELPARTDSMKLYESALAEHITILPGMVFCCGNRYRNYVRINCGHQWSEKYERALLRLGRLASEAGRRAA
jgi:DNA-binding transcriptional MocR family regulator